jgi:hypothetical protein
VLVVTEDDVVARPVLLDEIGFQDERLELVARDDALEIADLRHERVRLRIARPRLLEVGATGFERGGLPT